MDQSARRASLLPGYLLLGAAAFALAAAARTTALTDWDSWEYAALAMIRKSSALCLGRWWFIFLMRIAWGVGLAFGLTAENGFIAMQWTVAMTTVLGVVAIAYWTRLLTGSRAAAMLAGAMALLSPALAAYSSAVMTEAPTLLLLVLAMIGWELTLRRTSGGRPAWHVAVLSGFAFGVMANMREPALLLAAWPAASCLVRREPRRWRMLAWAGVGAGLSLAVAVAMAWQWSGESPVDVLRRYAAYMRQEREVYGFYPLVNAGYLLLHFGLASPLAAFGLLVAGAARLIRGRRRPAGTEGGGPGRLLATLALSTLPYVLMTWWNPDMWFNYRLLLPLAWMWIPVAAWALVIQLRRSGASLSAARTKALAVGGLCAALAITGTAGYGLLRYHFQYAAYQAELYGILRQLPHNASVVAGVGSPIAIYVKRSGQRPDWRDYPTAADWTAPWLADEFARALHSGRRVFVNADPRGWTRSHGPNHEWRALCEAMTHFRVGAAPGVFQELHLP